MAVDRREAGVTLVPDVRRRIVFLTHGAIRFLDRVHDGLQDIAGAIDRQQYLVAAAQARYVALLCLSIRGLASEGEVDMDGWSASFDFFAGVPQDEVAAALTLANDALHLDERTAPEWLERLQRYAAETEGLLGFDAPLPGLRSPAGVLAFIGIVRRWTPLLDELGLPAVLPPQWSMRPAAESPDA
jgi:hypothetical protein